MERFNEIRAQFLAAWSEMGLWQRISLVGVALVAVVGFGWLFTSATEPEWRVLYGDLDEATASKVIEELKNRQIPHKVVNPSTISVPQEHLYDTRLAIAGTGLTDTTAAGYELFDEADFGMTAFTQKVNYKRAMENELARTISHLKTVREARVHLVLPAESLFREDEKPPSASVVLGLERAAPSASQIQAVQHLVASAIEGMSPGNVTIVDQEGRLLARPDGEDAIAGSSGKGAMDHANKVERELEARVVELLAPLVGPDRVRAKVRVELDTTRVTETSEEYDPDKTAIRSEQRTESTASDGSTVAAGVPGIGSNLPGREGGERSKESNTASTSTSEVTNYEVTKRVRQVTQEGFSVSRVSVAVLLDDQALQTAEGASPLEAATVEKLVKSAVGFDVKRGDTVEVSMQAFRADTFANSEPPAWWRGPDVLVPALRYATLAFLALCLFFFVVRPLTNTFKSMNKETPELAHSQDPNSIDVEVVGRRVGDLDSEGVDTVSISGQGPYPQLRNEVVDLSTSDLDKTAMIVRQWIRSDAEA